MSTVAKLLIAVLVALGVIVGVQRCRDRDAQRAHTEAETKLDVADSVVRDRADSVQATEQPHTRTEHALAEVLHRPRLPRPTVSTGHEIATDTSTARDTTHYVRQSAYDSLSRRLDSVTVAATNYRAAAEDVIEAQKKLIVAQTNARIAAQNVIEHPAPGRRWSIGVGPGYGFALVKGRVEQAPTVTVSFTYRIF